MKTAAVSTYCEWSSFGSVLQSLSLQNVLEQMNVASTVYRVEDSEVFPPIQYDSWKNLRGAIKNIYTFAHRKEIWRAYQKNAEFIKKNVRVVTYPNQESLKKNRPEVDAYIAGSDQIWNVHIDREDFFLGYAPQGSCCISYAASMGQENIPEEKREWFRNNLKKFDTISVREQQMVPVIEKAKGEKPLVHIDPTFLKSADEWRKLQSSYEVKKPYILVYPIFWDSKLNAQLAELKKETGLQVISIHSGLRNIYADRRIRDADVGEFLWLVDHAECVITSSFHGVALSVIFNKKFSAVVNPQAPSRITNLLSMLRIETPRVKECISSFDVDYKMVNQRIEEEKTRSVDYLRRELFGKEEH